MSKNYRAIQMFLIEKGFQDAGGVYQLEAFKTKDGDYYTIYVSLDNVSKTFRILDKVWKFTDFESQSYKTGGYDGDYISDRKLIERLSSELLEQTIDFENQLRYQIAKEDAEAIIKHCPRCNSENYGIASDFGDKYGFVFLHNIASCADCGYVEGE